MKSLCAALCVGVLLASSARATEPTPPYWVPSITAVASNQRVDLTWDEALDHSPNAEPNVTGYRVLIFLDGAFLRDQTTTSRNATFFLENDRTYVFEVAAQLTDGTEGTRSSPVAATPHLARDLQYLAVGLIVTWLGLLGYAALLAQKEDRLAKKLEQLLGHQLGRNPP